MPNWHYLINSVWEVWEINSTVLFCPFWELHTFHGTCLFSVSAHGNVMDFPFSCPLSSIHWTFHFMNWMICLANWKKRKRISSGGNNWVVIPVFVTLSSWEFPIKCFSTTFREPFTFPCVWSTSGQLYHLTSCLLDEGNLETFRPSDQRDISVFKH